MNDESQTGKADPVISLADARAPAVRRTVPAPHRKVLARAGENPCIFRAKFQIPSYS
jgi:hypothetical protein